MSNRLDTSQTEMSPKAMKCAEQLPLFLRVHTRLKNAAPRSARNPRHQWARYALIIDAETSINTQQSLTFGFYRFCDLPSDGRFICLEEGIFYTEDLDRRSVGLIRKYVQAKRAETTADCPVDLQLYSRSEFVKEVFLRACDAGAVIVGCNLPFDLSRLAVEYRVSRKRSTGWSLILFHYYNRRRRKWLPNTYLPRIRMNPKDSRDSFISLAGGNKERGFRRGRFLNLLTMAWALRNRRHSLESACGEWRVPGKLDHKPTGKVTVKELNYCRQDVRATVSLLNAMKTEYETYPIKLQPEKVHSPASIAKAFLTSMNLRHPAEKYCLPDTLHGIAMQGYYGGRAEVRIRHTTVPIVYCDFTSQYPTANALLGIWPLLIAKDLIVEDVTKEIRDLLTNLELEQLFNPQVWLRLGFFALVAPENDILPVRTCYSDSGETNIGLNPLTSKESIWCAGPDLAAAVLLKTGRPPSIIKAVKLIPVGTQDGLVATTLGDRIIDPSIDNLFTAVIETRKQFSSDHPTSYFLKILANAGGYGMYAELNQQQFGKNSSKPIQVYSGEHYFERATTTVEVPGPWYFPPVSLITARGRLLLAMLEKIVTDAHSTYLMCDTDSMAIVSTQCGGLVPCNGGPFRLPDGSEAVKALPWQEVQRIARKFALLNPYDPKIVPDILKIEDYNYDRNGKQSQLYGWAISAKRYVLFTSDGEIIKPSEHGLGPYFHPNKKRYIPHTCLNQKDSYPQWMVEGWRWILGNELGPKQRSPDWFKSAAMRKVAITTPNVLARLRRIDRESAKPNNFVVSPMLIFGGPTLIAPFCDDPSRWTGLKNGLEYISVEDGTKFRICKPDEDELLISTPEFVERKNPKERLKYILSSQIRDFDMVFREYTRHPEAKTLAPDGSPCTGTTRGLLLRRPIEAIPPFRFIGKEVDRRMQDDLNVFSDVRPVEYHPIVQSQLRKPEIGPERHHYIARVLENNIERLSTKELARETGLDRNTIRRVRRGERVHPKTRLKLLEVAAN